MRALLESVARKDGFDPLAAENWYSVNGQDFLQRYKVSAHHSSLLSSPSLSFSSIP